MEAAAQLGITIPTLCWLKKISTTGACRICIVKIEGVERFMTACNTPVKDGIIVTTTSAEIEQARRKTLELMLVNHPLDCPVCDAAGECDLQDSCYSLKVDKNNYRANLERLPIRYDWKLLESDPNRCILCEKCVKVCREVVGREAIEIVNRGDNTIIDTKTGEPLDCDFCGNCVNACPTGTLISKPSKFAGRPWAFKVSKSVCAFCASGCQIEYHAKDGRIERVTSSDDGYNRGNLCVNGRFGYTAFNATERVTTPRLAGTAGALQNSTWEQALETVAGKLKTIIAASGPDAVAGIGSPRATNEENYLFQKFMRSAVGTNNIDSEARLGYLPSQIIQWEMLGYSGGTTPMDAIEQAEAVIVIGSDLKAESAGFAYRVIQAATKNNAHLVLAASRATSLNKFANSLLQYKPGSEAWLVAGLNKALLAEQAVNSAFIQKSTSSFDTLSAATEALSFDQISQACGISEAALRKTAALIANRKTAVIYGSEIIRSRDMAQAVTAVINLALLTGAVGENGAGIYPLDEKNNTQGMLDMGICPEYLPGYHSYAAMAPVFGKTWHATLPTTSGKNLFQMLEGIEQGTIKALYVMGSDPLRYMPERTRWEKALQKLELLVVQDLFITDTARYATVFLPAATGAEKAGSFTSIDNRVQSFTRAIPPAGLAKTDGDILTTLQSLLAPVIPEKKQTTAELDHEITTLSGLYRETCNDRGCSLWRVKNRVSFNDKPARFMASSPAKLTANNPAAPYQLVIGSILHHNGTYTIHSANNMMVAATPFISINPLDARSAGIAADEIVAVSSSTGSVTATARITDAVPAGTLFMPNHYPETTPGFLSKENALSVPVMLKRS